MPCNKQTSRCIIDYKHEILPECCKNNLKEILFNIDELFNKYNIPYWLDYGTLLGAVREGDILSNDEDCDIGILNQDVNKVLNISHEFFKRGLLPTVFGFPYGMNISYSGVNSLHVDIFFWNFEKKFFKNMWEEDNKFEEKVCLDRVMYCPCDDFKGRHFPVEMLFPLNKIKLADKEYFCPNNPEKFVEFRYGQDWRIPKII